MPIYVAYLFISNVPPVQILHISNLGMKVSSNVCKHFVCVCVCGLLTLVDYLYRREST